MHVYVMTEHLPVSRQCFLRQLHYYWGAGKLCIFYNIRYGDLVASLQHKKIKIQTILNVTTQVKSNC